MQVTGAPPCLAVASALESRGRRSASRLLQRTPGKFLAPFHRAQPVAAIALAHRSKALLPHDNLVATLAVAAPAPAPSKSLPQAFNGASTGFMLVCTMMVRAESSPIGQALPMSRSSGLRSEQADRRRSEARPTQVLAMNLPGVCLFYGAPTAEPSTAVGLKLCGTETLWDRSNNVYSHCPFPDFLSTGTPGKGIDYN